MVSFIFCFFLLINLSFSSDIYNNNLQESIERISKLNRALCTHWNYNIPIYVQSKIAKEKLEEFKDINIQLFGMKRNAGVIESFRFIRGLRKKTPKISLNGYGINACGELAECVVVNRRDVPFGNLYLFIISKEEKKNRYIAIEAYNLIGDSVFYNRIKNINLTLIDIKKVDNKIILEYDFSFVYFCHNDDEENMITNWYKKYYND